MERPSRSSPVSVSFESVEEEIRGEEIIPHVIEPSFGIDRILYTVLDHSYYEDAVDGETRAVLRFKPAVAPIEVAVLPLMDRKELVDPAKADPGGAARPWHARGLRHIRIDRPQIPAQR